MQAKKLQLLQAMPSMKNMNHLKAKPVETERIQTGASRPLP